MKKQPRRPILYHTKASGFKPIAKKKPAAPKGEKADPAVPMWGDANDDYFLTPPAGKMTKAEASDE